MPIYEYACAKCESEFEVEQRITDAPIKTCPKCKSRRVKRLISQTSFTLKGGGWYADGYGSSGGKSGGDKEATASGDATSGGDATKKADVKPKSDGGSESGSKPSSESGSKPSSEGGPKGKKAVA